jgi:hypothetical protein
VNDPQRLVDLPAAAKLNVICTGKQLETMVA